MHGAYNVKSGCFIVSHETHKYTVRANFRFPLLSMCNLKYLSSYHCAETLSITDLLNVSRHLTSKRLGWYLNFWTKFLKIMSSI